MSKYIYIGNEEFRGSIKGVAKFIRKGDLINPEDVGYFSHRYPNSITCIDAPTPAVESLDKDEIYQVLADQSSKINQLIDLIKNQTPTVIVSGSPVSNTVELQKSIEMQEGSMANLMKVDTSNIESQGSAGESKTTGVSVTEKIRRLQKLKRESS